MKSSVPVIHPVAVIVGGASARLVLALQVALSDLDRDAERLNDLARRG